MKSHASGKDHVTLSSTTGIFLRDFLRESDHLMRYLNIEINKKRLSRDVNYI